MVLRRVLLLLIPILAPLILEGGKPHHYLLTDKIARDEVVCMHKQARIDAPSVGTIPYDTHCIEVLRCTTDRDHQEWCRVAYFKKRGWISLAQASDDTGCTADANTSLVHRVLTLARSKLGAPYRYGKTGPDSFDCSGFVYYVFNRMKIPLPRTAILQSQTGPKLTYKELRPGDLLFFDTFDRGHIVHSGIYLGEGRFIHATSGNAFRVTISDLDHGFYKDKFRWGVRKIPTPDTNNSSTSNLPQTVHEPYSAAVPHPLPAVESKYHHHIPDERQSHRSQKQHRTEEYPQPKKKHGIQKIHSKQQYKPVGQAHKVRTKKTSLTHHAKSRTKKHRRTHSKPKHASRRKKMTLQEFGEQLKRSLYYRTNK